MSSASAQNETNVPKYQHSSCMPGRTELKTSIQEFLAEVSSSVPPDSKCPRCGAQLQYVETTFRLYGVESQWRVRVPVCQCMLADVDQ